ncbi:MAG: SMC-Scp complex subunit ScpB [Opitutaceae bacterium]|nr:SMC-Scp complex subunit ScpB [Opitutaceae bacterium]
MAFDLKQVLKVMLFASNGPLAAKDIQTAFTRFHEQSGELPLPADPETPETGPETGAPAGETPAGPAPTEEDEIYRDVPSLVTVAQIREAMEAIAAELHSTQGPTLLLEGHSGWRLVTHPRYARWMRLLRNEPRPARLSPSVIETLAIVAYRQPVTRAEIEHIRGVSAEAGLSKLLERDLVYVVGRADLPGRPIQYGTTDAFLEFVGIKSIDELPASDVLSPRQIDTWLQAVSQPQAATDADMGLDENEAEQLDLKDAPRESETPDAAKETQAKT